MNCWGRKKASWSAVGKFIDLTGQRFGRLTVLERAQNIGKDIAWLCQCDCRKQSVVLGNSLRRGISKSCGCLRDEMVSDRFTKHGATRYEKTHPDYRLYSIWSAMIFRCYNPNAACYQRYGGAGITVCDDWLHSFETFRCWAKTNGYDDALSIDRIDGKKGYSPENCRWATPLQQTRNRKSTRYLTYAGEQKTLKEWAIQYKISYHALKHRIDRGWPVERALTEPVKKK